MNFFDLSTIVFIDKYKLTVVRKPPKKPHIAVHNQLKQSR